MKKFRSGIYLFVFISFLLHSIFYLGLKWALANSLEEKAPPVEVVILDPSSPTQDEKQMQVVEQNKKAVNDEAPDKAKYLSQHNQKVVEETRAQKTGQFTNQASPGQKGSKAQAQRTQKSAKQKTSNLAKSGLPTLKQLKPSFQLNTYQGQKASDAKAGEESQTNDHLKDVKTGIQTMLSTKEFVYYAYYQRIRTKIRQYWEPIIKEKVEKVFASGRSIASAQDRTTAVIIVLNNKGALVGVQVMAGSGVQDLDDAAIEAFRAAEPFPNPPKGIVDSDGKIRIRWDFVLEAGLNLPNSSGEYAQAQPL